MELAAVDLLDLELIERLDVCRNHQTVLHDRAHSKLPHFGLTTAVDPERLREKERVLAASIYVNDSLAVNGSDHSGFVLDGALASA